MTNEEDKLRAMTDALNFLKHWSTGLVAIQSGAMAVLGSLVKNADKGLPIFWFGFSISCFLVSILVAAHVLGAIPMIAQKLPDLIGKYNDIYRIPNYFRIPLWVLALFQHIFFIAGIVGFGLFILDFGISVNSSS